MSGSIAMRLGPDFSPDRLLSLDHALWAHRPQRWDGWGLLDTRSEIAHAGRALTRREVQARDGVLVASIAQAALLDTAG